MEPVILQMVKWFIERQLLKYGDQLDLNKVKADLQQRVSDLLPGATYDAVAQHIVGVFIDIVAAYFASKGLTPSMALIPQAIDHASMSLNRELAAKSLAK